MADDSEISSTARSWDPRERSHNTSFIQTALTASSLPDRIQTACVIVSGCSPPRPSLYYVTGDTINAPTRSLRSAANRSLNIPRYNLERYGRRSFSVAGPSLWNNLPVTIREAGTLTTFKSTRKTHLFRIAFNALC